MDKDVDDLVFLCNRGGSVGPAIRFTSMLAPILVLQFYFFFLLLGFDLLVVFFFAVLYSMAACAAARRAIGTRNGEQDT